MSFAAQKAEENTLKGYCLVVGLSFPGNSFPVTEHPFQSNDHYHKASLEPGFQSHFSSGINCPTLPPIKILLILKQTNKPKKKKQFQSYQGTPSPKSSTHKRMPISLLFRTIHKLFLFF